MRDNQMRIIVIVSMTDIFATVMYYTIQRGLDQYYSKYAICVGQLTKRTWKSLQLHWINMMEMIQEVMLPAYASRQTHNATPV